jgi:ribosome-associated translation inhibitor RaiA
MMNDLFTGLKSFATQDDMFAAIDDVNKSVDKMLVRWKKKHGTLPTREQFQAEMIKAMHAFIEERREKIH